MLKYKIYINEILETIDKIDKSLKGYLKKEFLENDEKFDSTLMRLQTIRENIKKIPLKIKKGYKISWNKFERTRDIISHAYSNVNKDIIWDIIKNKLPELKKVIKDVSK
ncbi:DUF86 domain-containing protein [Candidatus Pacearchaeota archaeon]|nr:DUF86 domain-containing protein [Candidatus Pacearchaeota archaeon]